MLSAASQRAARLVGHAFFKSVQSLMIPWEIKAIAEITLKRGKDM
jgi:hypothetical protein